MPESHRIVDATGVVAAHPLPAARAGATILRAGGNAFDAAVAAGVVCGLLEPNQTGLGGYVLSAVVRIGATGELWSVDANGPAPAAARPDMFRVLPPDKHHPPVAINEQEYGCTVAGNANVHGPLAVSVPGLIGGLGTISERWGKLPWADLLAPGVQLLTTGFPYGPVAAAIRQNHAAIQQFPETVAYLMPAGRLPTPEETWHCPQLLDALRHLASRGWRDWYTGELAGRMADHIQALGGLLTRADLAAFQPRVTAPYQVTYRGATVAGAILANGSITPLQALLMMQHLELPASDTPHYFHLLAEILKLVWRDRLAYLGDDSPAAARLLDPAYAAGRIEGLRQFPAHVDRLKPEPVPEGPTGTRHVAAADAAGNVVTMTITQGGPFGSLVTVPGTGLVLGHGMCRFDPRPGRPNSVAPGKRPFNNTCPMMVGDGRRWVGLGLPGGRTIVSITTRAVQALVDRGLDVGEMAALPRLHCEGSEPLQLEKAVPEATVEALRGLGHTVKRQTVLGGPLCAAEWRAATGETVAGCNYPAVAGAGEES